MSSRTVVVTGVGLSSALGDARQTWQRLLAGTSAIALRQPFCDLPPLPLALVGKAPADLDWLTEQAATAALADAQLAKADTGTHAGIVVGSSRSYQFRLEQLAQAYRSGQPISPGAWHAAQPGQLAGKLAARLGCQGPVLAPMAACATGLWAIAQAWLLIQSGQCDRAIAGAAEAPVTPLTLAGFGRMGALAKTGCFPFDADREGLVLGEGAAVLVLETAAQARRRGVLSYAQVLGFGLTNDAHHVSSPMPGYGGAIAAVRQCLQRSRIAPQQIDYIHAHGTATCRNDAMEAAVIGQLFPHRPRVSATKGATGHTLGASGALGAAVCLLALRHQQVPPTVGLRQSPFELNLVRPAAAPGPEPLTTALCCSFGFGGQNGAIALARL